MFYNKEISIIGESEGYVDDYGAWVDGEMEIIKTIECDVQPLTNEIAYREYGYNQNVEYRVFADIDELLKNGTTVKYKEHEMMIVKVVLWDDYCILLLNGVE